MLFRSMDKTEKRPYSPYNEDSNLIYILMPDETIRELSQVSAIVNAVVYGQAKTEMKLFYPKEVNT